MTLGTLIGWLAFVVFALAARAWIHAIQTVSIPENRRAYVIASVATLALAGGAFANAPGWLGGVPATIGVIGAVFFLFTFAIGDQRLAAGAIGVGDPIPAFTAQDEHQATFDSADLAGHPVLIKFFRGHW